MRYLYLSFILILSHFGMAQNLSKAEFVKAVNTIGVYCVNTSLSGNAFVQTKYVTIEDFEKEKQAELNRNTGTNALLQEFKKFRDQPKGQFKSQNYLKGVGEKSIFSVKEGHDQIAKFFDRKDRRDLYEKDFNELLKIAGLVDPNGGTNPATDVSQSQLLEQGRSQDSVPQVNDSLPTKTVENDVVTTPSTEPIVAEVGFFELKPLSVGLILGVVLGFIGTVLLLKKFTTSDKKEDDINYKKDRIASTPISVNTPVSNDLIKYQDQVKDLKEENRQLLAKIAELEKPKQAIVQPKEQMIEEIVSAPIELEVAAPAPTKSVKYYSIPNQDGIFIAEKSRESSIYSVEYINDNEGIFYIDISDRYLQDAIFEMSTFIDCGCEYTATPSSSTKGIRVLQTGSVINESGNWRIVEKCKIEFV